VPRPRDVGFSLTYGQGLGSPEPTDIGEHRLPRADRLRNLRRDMHNLQVQEFANAVGRGSLVIVVDPRFSVAASKASTGCPIKPGTDIALLLAWYERPRDRRLVRQDLRGAVRSRFRQVRRGDQVDDARVAAAETGLDPTLIRTTGASSRCAGRTRSCIRRRSTGNGDDSASAAARSPC